MVKMENVDYIVHLPIPVEMEFKMLVKIVSLVLRIANDV